MNLIGIRASIRSIATNMPERSQYEIIRKNFKPRAGNDPCVSDQWFHRPALGSWDILPVDSDWLTLSELDNKIGR
jgi:hypothetical protein